MKVVIGNPYGIAANSDLVYLKQNKPDDFQKYKRFCHKYRINEAIAMVVPLKKSNMLIVICQRYLSKGENNGFIDLMALDRAMNKIYQKQNQGEIDEIDDSVLYHLDDYKHLQ